ncbi:MAG: cation-translocating P-type ATPase [Caldisericia bacterium]|nr:cation-translocating P-type ATPase [Caldisericia bacterium]
MIEKTDVLKGLSSVEAQERQKKFGKNELIPKRKNQFVVKILHILREPMFLLLIVAATIYFILGEPQDGFIMMVFVVGIIGIDVFQEWKSNAALEALRDLSAPHIFAIRDGEEVLTPSIELVPGDIMKIHEGDKVPADGEILLCNDICVDESSLTGESEAAWKSPSCSTGIVQEYWRKDYCYAGTLVVQGSATVLVEKTGSSTVYGKIGISISDNPGKQTPLQKQTRDLVKRCSWIAVFLFLLVSTATYLNIPTDPFKERIIASILSGVTLAMAMIPEEFPVILTVFLSMGAWRLAKKNSLVRSLSAVETLGAISTLCVDKTGTITRNQMVVQDTWSPTSDVHQLLQMMGLSCEIDPYDPMEKAMLTYYEDQGLSKEDLFHKELLLEYPFNNEMKMMGHVWRGSQERITIAAKGSPESILKICNSSSDEKKNILDEVYRMSTKGLRVIAVAYAFVPDQQEIPDTITKCSLSFCGLIGLADPPRDSISEDVETCIKAGIRLVMITGDNGITARSIGRQIGLPNHENTITGKELDLLSDKDLQARIKEFGIFSRVTPAHKMRIVKTFQEMGEIVAMTGDGVNDAPALQHADIGIAMGKRGSEVAREASDLILLDDNFSTIVATMQDGRRMYDNIRKAVGYVFTIHIPIALSSLVSPMIGIQPMCLFLFPLHIVLLELMIDPTCSIVLERQPSEKGSMDRPPRNPREALISFRLLRRSVLQGLVLFAASFGTYYVVLQQTNNAALARTFGLVIIIVSNLFLVYANSSVTVPVFKMWKLVWKDRVMQIVNIATIVGLLLIVYTPLHVYLKLTPLSMGQFLITFAIAFVAVFWIELFKKG